MIDLTYSEAYALSFIGTYKKNIKINTLAHIMLGLYVCDFLDMLDKKGKLGLTKKKEKIQEWVHEYFRQPRNIWERENILLPILEKLNEFKLLKFKKEKIFNYFSLLHCTHAFNFKNWIATTSTTACNDGLKFPLHKSILTRIIRYISLKKKINTPPRFENLNEFILYSIESYKPIENHDQLKEIIELFNKKLFGLFKKYKIKKSKYELRFFWPNPIIPEVFETFGQVFNKKNYKFYLDHDNYILRGKKISLKLRNHQLQIKDWIQDFYKIVQFTKKRKINLPFKTNFLKNFLGKNIINVTKKRYIQKIAPHTKIEFSIIKIQRTTWKTICIESKKIEMVLALSFLINQKYSERLTYSEFLNKHTKS